MNFVEVLPKNEDGNIILSPIGSYNGKEFDGFVNPQWLEDNHPNLALASVPLSDTDYQYLMELNDYWAQNGQRWRNEGLI